MPDADGRDICRQIRNGSSARARIAITGYRDLERNDDVKSFDSHIVKPGSLKQLERLDAGI
ncbi:hypothetical protein [Caballeronia sp. S22]|uniref:hypothetical protein n=1 Tax=Caballeronia sp. S22 TaxID=3137182 RepID=UPI0035308683